MRHSYEKAELEGFFRKIGEKLPSHITVFLLGGGAMAFRNQKTATKDLDLVFENGKECKEFVSAIKELAFKEKMRLEIEYEDMEARGGIWEEPGGFRLDLFVKKVCGNLQLSQGVKERGELLGKYGNLSVRMLSNEDIMLFKAVTERSGDADDIAAIVRNASIDWNVLLKECQFQSKERNWYASVLNKMEEIKQKYGIDAPIIPKLRKASETRALKEAYERRRKAGKTREEAMAEFKAMGFTRKEIAHLLQKPPNRHMQSRRNVVLT